MINFLNQIFSIIYNSSLLKNNNLYNINQYNNQFPQYNFSALTILIILYIYYIINIQTFYLNLYQTYKFYLKLFYRNKLQQFPSILQKKIEMAQSSTYPEDITSINNQINKHITNILEYLDGLQIIDDEECIIMEIYCHLLMMNIVQDQSIFGSFLSLCNLFKQQQIHASSTHFYKEKQNKTVQNYLLDLIKQQYYKFNIQKINQNNSFFQQHNIENKIYQENTLYNNKNTTISIQPSQEYYKYDQDPSQISRSIRIFPYFEEGNSDDNYKKQEILLNDEVIQNDIGSFKLQYKQEYIEQQRQNEEFCSQFSQNMCHQEQKQKIDNLQNNFQLNSDFIIQQIGESSSQFADNSAFMQNLRQNIELINKKSQQNPYFEQSHHNEPDLKQQNISENMHLQNVLQQKCLKILTEENMKQNQIYNFQQQKMSEQFNFHMEEDQDSQSEILIKTQIKGHVLYGDKIEAIVALFYQNSDKNIPHFQIKWASRNNGFLPQNSFVDGQAMKVHHPQKLIQFYEKVFDSQENSYNSAKTK